MGQKYIGVSLSPRLVQKRGEASLVGQVFVESILVQSHIGRKGEAILACPRAF